MICHNKLYLFTELKPKPTGSEDLGVSPRRVRVKLALIE